MTVRRVLQANGGCSDSILRSDMFIHIYIYRAFGKAYPDTVDEVFNGHWFALAIALCFGAGVDIVTAGNPGSRSQTWIRWLSMD